MSVSTEKTPASTGRQRVDGAQAYLLHTYPYSETSLILEVFSRQHGRLALLARGARRPRSALRGLLMGFAPLELGWFGSGEVKTLAKAEWVGGLPLLSGKSLLLGYYLNELLLKLLPREDAHPVLFDAYADALAALARASVGTDSSDAAELRRFERVLLREIGYGYAFQETASGQAVQPENHYVVLAGQGTRLATEEASWNDDDQAPRICGQTLLDMAADDYRNARTRLESKAIMRHLLTHYLGEKPLHARRIFASVLGQQRSV